MFPLSKQTPTLSQLVINSLDSSEHCKLRRTITILAALFLASEYHFHKRNNER